MVPKSEAKKYTAESITVLEGLEPVRKRPAMYIGSTGTDGLHHLIWEVLDNSIDEAMAGYANEITVRLLPDSMIEVKDNGRGIPVDTHKQTKRPALETIMTTLHAGGKFGDEGYKVSGGLHGVGVSVVNALSEFTSAEIYRDGKIYYQEYKYGKPTGDMKTIGNTEENGSKITFKPDKKIFNTLNYNLRTILEHCREQAFLTKGTKITLFDDRDEKARSQESESEFLPRIYTFYFEGGIKAYINHLTRDKEKLVSPIYINKSMDDYLVEIALVYSDEFNERVYSFANNIHTSEGGFHLTGFRAALTRVINDYIKKQEILKNGEVDISGEDIREGLVGIISVKLPNPQFEGQTKSKLGNAEIRPIVEGVVGQQMAIYFEEHPSEARKIIEKVLLAARARVAARAARDTVIRKGVLEGMTLPGKLADCASRKPEESEILIVEGDSAGGSAKQGRDRSFQAILPLRGKILNVERARLDKMLANNEIKSLIIALGAGIDEEFNIDKIRYHRIIIMTDADVDGSHIRTLLLTLFYRYFPQIIEKGYLYIAQPPLYAISKGKNKAYAYTEEDKITILDEFKKKHGDVGIGIQRYKGLGEMNPDQLWITTLDPENRVLLQVKIQEAEEADRIFSMLMGDEVEPRKRFIQTRAKSVQNLDI
ncbi:DNA topoisomerase (ATP-hydrolyzing) subunit B [Patescibacteria group bacterium]